MADSGEEEDEDEDDEGSPETSTFQSFSLFGLYYLNIWSTLVVYVLVGTLLGFSL